MQNNKFNDFVQQDDKQYASIIDEYRRIKYFKYQKNFNVPSAPMLFELLIRCLKHMFKIKRDFTVGIEFGLNVKNTYTLYTLTELDYDKKYLSLEWSVDNDLYLLEFQLTAIKNSKHTKIIFKQRIQREKTFFGMADFIGIVIYKKAFKANMKAFCGYIKHLIEHGEMKIIQSELNFPDTNKNNSGSQTEVESTISKRKQLRQQIKAERAFSKAKDLAEYNKNKAQRQINHANFDNTDSTEHTIDKLDDTTNAEAKLE